MSSVIYQDEGKWKFGLKLTEPYKERKEKKDKSSFRKQMKELMDKLNLSKYLEDLLKEATDKWKSENITFRKLIYIGTSEKWVFTFNTEPDAQKAFTYLEKIHDENPKAPFVYLTKRQNK